MSKSKSTTAKAATAAASGGERIPLAELEITWFRDPHFIGEEEQERVPVTIQGKDLLAVLRWMGRRAPGKPTALFDDRDYLARVLRGLGALAEEVGDSSADGRDRGELRELLGALGEVVADYGTRLEAGVRDPDADAGATLVVRRRGTTNGGRRVSIRSVPEHSGSGARPARRASDE